ncbi:MAG: transposase [Clostridia bacterium]|nr:transposase [Clostridia bacterium]
MNIISQISLFDNEQIEILGDLERLKLAIENMPDEEIVRKLKEIRKNGRDDWPVEVMWNTFIASFVFNHRSVNDLLRELSRNSQLRQICGLKPKFKLQKDGTTKIYLVPSEAAYSRFLANLVKCKEEMENAFNGLVDYMYENLDGFGEDLAGDGKAVDSYATKNGKKSKDKRGDADANWGVKKYTESTNDKGEKLIKKKSWFGYRLHLIVDTKYELPVAYKVTKASNSEKAEMLKIWKDLNSKRPEVVRRAREFLADKGYDWKDLILLLEKYGISPIIDIQNHWKDEEVTKQYKDTDIVYTFDGKIYYADKIKDNEVKYIKLLYAGYDKKTESLRYKFPPTKNDKRIYRIKIEEDPRVFTPIARDSMKWKREYKKRTSVERENGRIDRDMGFEKHTIRGIEKMTMFITMGFLIQLSMAKGKIEENKDKIEEIKNKHLSALIA